MSNPDSFALALRASAIQSVKSHLGESCFLTWVDSGYYYPHYYKNVYYNSAESERCYKVFFRTYPVKGVAFSFELSFGRDGKKLVTELDEVLPKCRTFSRKCRLLEKETILGIARAQMKLNLDEYSLHFSIDPGQNRFFWTVTVQKLTKYPIGTLEVLKLDAASGQKISYEINHEYYMGR